MEGCQMCAIAFAKADLFSTAVLVHPGAPNSQLEVVAMGMCESCVTSSGEHPMAVDSSGESPGAQLDLWGILANPTLLVFQVDIIQDVHVR